MFIKSDHDDMNLKFIINNKDFSYDILVDKLKYLKIENNELIREFILKNI